MSAAPKTRPKYYDLNLAHLPPPGLVSIFHRISGALLFFLAVHLWLVLKCGVSAPPVPGPFARLPGESRGGRCLRPVAQLLDWPREAW